MGQTAHVENFAAFGQEGTNIGPGIHGTSQDFGVLMRGLRLANQTPEDSSQSDGFFHRTSGRRGSQGLEVERKVVLDGCGRLDGLNFEGGTDVGQRAGAKGQRFRVMSLPPLVFSAKVEGAGVLQVWRQNHGLVTGLSRKLDTEIPRVQGNKGELQVLAQQVLLSKRVEAVDGVPKGSCRADMLPGQSRQTRYIPSAIDSSGQAISIDGSSDLLQRGVMGVLTGLTRTLSR